MVVMSIWDRIALRFQARFIAWGLVALPFAVGGYVYATYILLTNVPVLLGLLIVLVQFIAVLGQACSADRRSGHRPE